MQNAGIPERWANCVTVDFRMVSCINALVFSLVKPGFCIPLFDMKEKKEAKENKVYN
jgi:hypothetical protein